MNNDVDKPNKAREIIGLIIDVEYDRKNLDLGKR